MARYCAACGAQMADTAVACPACGKPVAQPAGGGPAATPATATSGGLTDNVAGMLAYVTVIPAIVFLVLEPYNRNRFIRFHAFQSIFFAIAWTAVWIALGIVPFFRWITLMISPLIGLAGFVIWILLLLKANKGEMWKLPVIGDMAEKQANA